MKKSNLLILLVVGVVVIAGALMLANKPAPKQTAQNQMAAETVKLSNLADGTKYLTDANGMTLYYFTKDTPDKSTCTANPCLSNWPAFYAADIQVNAPLNRADFGSISREDGSNQTTYNGLPLYYFIKDAQAGDVKGQGLNDAWFIVKP